MKATFLALAALLMASSSLFAQPLPPTLKPQIGVTVFSDGKPTDQQTGLKAATKEIRFKALLNTKLNDSFSDFKPELLIENTQILLIRNGRKIAQVNVPDGHLVNYPIQSAQSADRIVFVFTLVAQRKNGELVALSDQPTYSFLVH